MLWTYDCMRQHYVTCQFQFTPFMRARVVMIMFYFMYESVFLGLHIYIRKEFVLHDCNVNRMYGNNILKVSWSEQRILPYVESLSSDIPKNMFVQFLCVCVLVSILDNNKAEKKIKQNNVSYQFEYHSIYNAVYFLVHL